MDGEQAYFGLLESLNSSAMEEPQFEHYRRAVLHRQPTPTICSCTAQVEEASYADGSGSTGFVRIDRVDSPHGEDSSFL